MNGIIIYSSKHLGNTKKIALEIASKIGVKAIDFNTLPENFDISTYELVGFGSGIYTRNFDHKFIKWMKALTPAIDKQNCFLFSTSGAKNAAILAHKKIDEILNTKNREIIGRWSCLGHDKFFIFKLWGGFNKGRPNESDIHDLHNWIEHTLKIM